MALERLQKILASAGIASRRKAEELITSGRVSVNGETVTELGSKANLETDDVRVDGKRVQGPEQHLYIMLYKPREIVTTVSDPEGRPTVMDLVRDIRERIFPVGRLDFNSEGLLLLTNDGDLMQELTAPTSHVPKTYLVKVSGQPSEEDLNKLRSGIKLPAEPSMTKGRGRKRPGEGRRSFAVTTLPAKVQIVRHGDNPWYEITLTEGRNRQIRRMFEEIGHHVEKIKRVRYGPLELNVEPGKWRPLSPVEVSKLRASLKKPVQIRPPKPSMRDDRDIQKLAARVIGKSKMTRARREWTDRPPKREWTERPPRRESSDRPPRREFTDRPRREGSFEKERGPRREGSYAKKEGGFSRPKREGGYSRGPEREGGFSRGPRREGGFEGRPRREGGYSRTDREGSFSRGPKREGGFGDSRRPKREGSSNRGPKRNSGYKRPGGFSRGPKKEGGPRRDRD